MAQALKFGKGVWATKTGSSMAYNDQNDNYKPLPFNVERDSIATRVNKEGLIEVVGHDKLRIDYTDTDKGVALLENSATNLVTYSEDFSQSSWSSLKLSVSDNDIISPDGTLNASKISRTSSGGSSYVRSQISVSTGLVSFSVFAKYNNRQFIQLLSGLSYANYDLINGIVTDSSSDSSIENYGNGWYRLIININFNTTLNYFYIWNIDSANSARVEASTGNGGVYIWGAQVEQGNLSSYIPTSGSTVQRAADVANGSGNSEVFSDTSGVLFANIAALANDQTERQITIDDGNGGNRIVLRYNSVSNNINAYLFNGSVQGGEFNQSLSDISLFSKCAFKYKTNNFQFWINGFKVGVDTNGSTFSDGTLSDLNFDFGGSFNFYGKTKEIGYYDAVLTDSELEYLTSYRSLSELVKELNLNTL